MFSNSPSYGGAVPISDESEMKPACKTEILFRIWRRDTESRDSAASREQSANEPGVVAFLEDIVASRRGLLIPTDKNLFVSRLENPAQALVLARQVQLGMEEFHKKSKSKPVAISIAIDSNVSSPQPFHSQSQKGAEEVSETTLARASQVSHDLLTLIRISRPAQVLLTHELFQKVTAFKGLPLKAFPGRFGVFEYLWAPEEKLVGLQNDDALLVDPVETEKPKLTPTLAPVEKPPSTEADELPDFSFHRKIRAESDTPRNMKLIVLVASLLVVVIGGGITFISKGRKQDTPPRSTNKVVSPVVPVDRPDARQPTGPVVKPPEVHTETTKVSEKRLPKHKVDPKPATSSAEDEEAAAPPLPPAKEECDLPGNLQESLDQAENYRAHGDYKGAERLFTKILICDPGNARAKTGLFRARSAQE
jgi:hypothetical protein